MIEKATKAKLRRIRELLRDRAVRDVDGKCVVEGLKIIDDLLEKKHIFDCIILSHGFVENKLNKTFLLKLMKSGISLFESENKNFEKISSLCNSQGVLAVVNKNSRSNCAQPFKKNALVVFCDGIQDPGNLGAIIRSAAAFNAEEVVLTSKTVDIYNPKVIRASSGAVFDITVNAGGYKKLDALKKDGYSVFVSCTDKTNAVEISKIAKSGGSFVLVFGSEGTGVSKGIEQRADCLFTIGMTETVESLNVAAAVAISLYEFRRLHI
ncbi:MAG: RNA methyltransferase [Candidatus Omnitrophota bacterium]